MQMVSPRKWPLRLSAALVLLCYFCLSTLLPFQHRHNLADDMEALLLQGISVSRAAAPAPVHTSIGHSAKVVGSTHCAACEWQAASVSPALPAIAIILIPPAIPAIGTTLPPYVRLAAHVPSSRAPPLA